MKYNLCHFGRFMKDTMFLKDILSVPTHKSMDQVISDLQTPHDTAKLRS